MNSNDEYSKLDGSVSTRPARKKWLVGLTSVAILAVPGYFTAQHFLTPDVDPNLTAPSVIETQNDPSVSEWEGIPEGSPTRLITQKMVDEADHPLLPILDMAKVAIKKIDDEIQDYSANLLSHVRVRGKLGVERFLEVKIRHENDNPTDKTQFSVYTRFVKPKTSAGQEAIWVKGWHKDKIVAHGAGLQNIMRLYLDPDGAMAMADSRGPIYDIGIRNLLVLLAEKGERDLKHQECEVKITRGVEVDGNRCTLITVTHPLKRDHFEFHIAKMYIDDVRGFPVAYEGYVWPESQGGEPVLIEKYFYTNIKTNIGLKDIDFDPANENYNYPSW